MAWVRTFDESKATWRLAEVYAELKRAPLAGGRVPNIMKCMSLRPEALMGVWRLNMAITFGGPPPRGNDRDRGLRFEPLSLLNVSPRRVSAYRNR